MERIVMPLEVAKQVARMILPHVGTDDVTPVLTGVYFESQHAYATDRYSVGRFDLTNMLSDDSTDGPVWVPREALAALRTVGKSTLRWGNRLLSYYVIFETVKESGSTAYTSVEIEWRPESGDPEVHWMRVFNANGATGNYPPVSRFFETFIPGEEMRFGMAPHNLAKFTSPLGRTPEPIRVTMPATTSGKSGPILIEVGNRFKGFAQPSLILNGNGFGADIAMDNLAAKQKSDEAEPSPAPEGGE